jgi:hypothetical protein
MCSSAPDQHRSILVSHQTAEAISVGYNISSVRRICLSNAIFMISFSCSNLTTLQL